MSKKARTLLISVIGILAFVLTALIFLLGIREEFKTYLSETYPQLSFTVGFTKIDPVYGKFFANVTCLNDYVSFPITKSFNTKRINEGYPQFKSKIQYNSKIKGIIEGSDISSNITSVTGGGEIPFGNGDAYSQINLYFTDNTDAIPVARKVLTALKENNISAERIILTYERDKHVFEIMLSSNDYALNENELQGKIRMIK